MLSDPVAEAFGLIHRHLRVKISAVCSFSSSFARSHYLERASALEFKDAAAPRSGHSDVVLDLFIETQFLHLIALLSNFSKLF